MPPFRYLGNIRGRIGARFGLEAGHGKAKITLAPTKAGWLMQMGACSFFWKPIVLRTSVSTDSCRSGPMHLSAHVLTSEMFVWHAA